MQERSNYEPFSKISQNLWLVFYTVWSTNLFSQRSNASVKRQIYGAHFVRRLQNQHPMFVSKSQEICLHSLHPYVLSEKLLHWFLLCASPVVLTDWPSMIATVSFGFFPATTLVIFLSFLWIFSMEPFSFH